MTWSFIKKKPSTKQIFMVITIIMWVISFLADLVNKNYNPPEYVNPLIMLVGGYLLARSSDDKEKK